MGKSSHFSGQPEPQWMTALDYRLHHNHAILQSTIQRCGQPSQNGQKEGRRKSAYVIHANEGVSSDIKFTSAATNDSFMLKPSTLSKGDIMAMDRAYIDHEKFEQLTTRGVIYVTKMKKSLKFSIQEDAMWQNVDGLMEVRV